MSNRSVDIDQLVLKELDMLRKRITTCELACVANRRSLGRLQHFIETPEMELARERQTFTQSKHGKCCMCAEMCQRDIEPCFFCEFCGSVYCNDHNSTDFLCQCNTTLTTTTQ